MESGKIENNAPIKAAELMNANVPRLDGKASDFSDYTFWQYTNVDSICKILSRGCF